MTKVASRFYLQEHSKIEIAREFDISRFQVARLLDSAQAHGLVHIDIRYPAPLNAELAEHRREAYRLRRVVVTESSYPDPARTRHAVAQAAAEFLRHILSPTDILGLGWARTVNAWPRRSPFRRRSPSFNSPAP